MIVKATATSSKVERDGSEKAISVSVESDNAETVKSQLKILGFDTDYTV
jgi:hypothetical protein